MNQQMMNRISDGEIKPEVDAVIHNLGTLSDLKLNTVRVINELEKILQLSKWLKYINQETFEKTIRTVLVFLHSKFICRFSLIQNWRTILSPKRNRFMRISRSVQSHSRV